MSIFFIYLSRFYIFCDIKILYCEDKTTFGYLGYDNSIYAFNIVDIEECLDVILESSVNYLLQYNSYQNDKYMKLLPASNEFLKDSKNKMASDIKMLDFKPKVIGASLFIPNTGTN